MNEITIRPEMTYQEYCAYQDAVQYGSVGPIFFWTALAHWCGFVGSQRGADMANALRLLAGLAFAVFLFFGYLLFGRIGARRRKAYQWYRESNTSYTFTNDRILTTSRYVQISVAWAAVDRVIVKRTVYFLVIRTLYICVPKRDIPQDGFDDFIQLRRTHNLLSEAQR